MADRTTDVLVIGGGIAGLSIAERVARQSNKRIVIISKGELLETNTRYAQGGIAVVLDHITDSFEKHISDTLRAGDGLCDQRTVRTVVKQAPECIQALIGLGAQFDKTHAGSMALGMEGGHSAHRVIHRKDRTGLEIQNTLIKAIEQCDQVERLIGYFAIDLVKDTKGHCRGVTLLDPDGNPHTIFARHTVLATGGIGQLYEVTTNPEIATGDGIAMASRAGARIENMAFVQFHPTALVEPGANPSFLISEAVRGFGAELRNQRGEAFMLKSDKRGSLATRDIVSKAIFKEMQSSGTDHVYLDVSCTDLRSFSRKFPTIQAKCDSLGLDLVKDMIPVAPAAHYLCGGVKTDERGQTSIPGLFCLGESSCTGMHGANRLASNSLLEALVFARHAADSICNTEDKHDLQSNVTMPSTLPQSNARKSFAKEQLRSLMTEQVGIIRSRKALRNALRVVQQMKHDNFDPGDVGSLELRNMAEVAELIITDSLDRDHSVGGLWFQ